MEVEPSTPVTMPESSMTIDYDNDPLNATLLTPEVPSNRPLGPGADEEMGDDAVTHQPGQDSQGQQQEAEMADDETVDTGNDEPQDVMVEEDAGTSLHLVSDEAPATQAPDVTIEADEVSEKADVIVVATTSAEPVSDVSTIASNATNGIADDASAAPVASPPQLGNGPSEEESESAIAEVQNDVPVVQDVAPDEAATTLTDEETIVASASALGKDKLVSIRPRVDKSLLGGIEVPMPESSESTNALAAPAILLEYDNTAYSLFRAPIKIPNDRVEGDETDNHDESGTVTTGEEQDEQGPQTLLTGQEQQQLYFATLEQLFSTLHEQFPELSSREDELVLDFDEIGIAITEDNIYSRQISLHDFDRIHLGCGLPGRLHARLYAQTRFSSGFNALAQHVAKSLNGIGSEEAEHDSEATYDEGTVNGDDEEYLEESFVTVGQPEDHAADGPDSELPVLADGSSQDEPAHVYEQTGEDGDEEEFDLESALAQLDGDNIVAYAEGVAEDFILSEGAGERSETTRESGVQEQEQEQEAVGEATVVVAETPPEGHTEVSEQVDEATVVAEPAAVKSENEPESGLQPSEDDKVETQANVPTSDSSPLEVSDLAGEAEDSVDKASQVEDSNSAAGITTSAPGEQSPLAVADPTMGISETVAGLEEKDDVQETVVEPSKGVDEPITAGSIEAESTTEAEAADPNDVVIDYDEAFDGSSVTALPASDGSLPVDSVASNEVTAVEEEIRPAHSPKRRHDSLNGDLGDEAVDADVDGGDVKRPRLDEPAPETSAA
ncbi:uncharacterized protein JCM15063_001330 [Sporobolomyces koalae]|uniref:uncharacterized protein n=1 Tax=Sporobolomyces koalae TaxID=500713 RepID=UPI00316F8685